MPKFEKHIFICGNQRPEEHPRGSCDPAATGDLQREFKRLLSKAGVSGSAVRANKAGCLDQCEHGPTVVVYPEAVWYGNVTLADIGEIVESHIKGNRPVERLQIPDTCLDNPTCEHRKPE
jgi:(2Fe-2S) ferredoxin